MATEEDDYTEGNDQYINNDRNLIKKESIINGRVTQDSSLNNSVGEVSPIDGNKINFTAS